MKNSLLKNGQWILLAALMTISLNAISQKTIIWKGGTPGMKNEWNCPQNWSTSTVPDEFSDVIIPDVSTSTFSLPVISSGIVEINSINIYSNSSLTIKKEASIIVLGDTTKMIQENVCGKGEILHHDQSTNVSQKMIAGRESKN